MITYWKELLNQAWGNTAKEPPNRSTSTKEHSEAVLNHAKQLEATVRSWEEGRGNHNDFAKHIIMLEAAYDGFPSLLWNEDRDLAESLLSNHNHAVRLVMATYSAIDSLRENGFELDAPTESKKQTLAKFCRQQGLQARKGAVTCPHD